MITVDFKGKHKGVHLHQRSKDDLHICVGVLTKNDSGDWSIDPKNSFSSSWMEEMIEQLNDASYYLKYRLVNTTPEFKGECMGVKLINFHNRNCDIQFMVEDDGYWFIKPNPFPSIYLDDLIEQFEKADKFLKTQQPDMGTESWQKDIQYGWEFDIKAIRKLKLDMLKASEKI